MGPKRTDLESGAIVVSESMTGVESVSFGLYFPTGSRFETRENNGISHFIEHLVFKGTPTRTADEINREIDALGGASNAYTSKETICLHARVLAEQLPRAISFMAELATDGLPEGIESEVERERRVILSEIRSVEDSPEDQVGELIDDAYFGDHPLALPIVGSVNAVARLDLAEIRSHYRKHLVAQEMVVAAAGKLDHDALVELVRSRLDAVPTGETMPRSSNPAPGVSSRVIERELEQVHICLSARGISGRDPRWAAAELLSVIVGDGYSSRLFREVRDRRGLAYSVFSSLISYTDAGSFNVDVAVAPRQLDEALEVIGQVLATVRDGDLTREELEAAKQHLRGSVLLGHESTSARMSYLAEQVLYGETNLELEHDLQQIESVDLEQVRAMAAELFSEPLAVAAIGPLSATRFSPLGYELPS
ncbi:MAG: insulinase family protein [bacterium]|nr:insulinase family protein [bacterium]